MSFLYPQVPWEVETPPQLNWEQEAEIIYKGLPATCRKRALGRSQWSALPHLQVFSQPPPPEIPGRPLTRGESLWAFKDMQ